DGSVARGGRVPGAILRFVQRSRQPLLADSEGGRSGGSAAPDPGGTGAARTRDSHDPGVFAAGAGPQLAQLRNLAGTLAAGVVSQRTCTTNSDSYQFLVGLFAGAAEGFRQGFKQVGCDERMLTDCFTSHIPCQAVEMHCDENSIQNSLRILCDKTCNYPREN